MLYCPQGSPSLTNLTTMAADASEPNPSPAPTLPARGKGGPSTRLLAFAAGAVVAVVVVACALMLSLFGRTPPPIVASLPANIDALAEVADLRSALAHSAAMAIVEAENGAVEGAVEGLNKDLAAAFDVPKKDAESFTAALAAVSVVARNVARGEPEEAVVLSFTSEGAVDALLASPRFRKEGAVGASGQRYLVETRPGSLATGAVGALERGLALLSERPGGAIAWFGERRLLAFGDLSLLTDVAAVIEEEKPSLADAPVYARARDELADDADGVGLFDLNVLKQIEDGPSKALFEGYLKDVGPIAASLRMTRAGAKMEMLGHLAGEKLPKTLLFEAPKALDLASRLPAETVGYLALSTTSALDGAGARSAVLDQLRAYDPRGDLGLSGDLRKALGDFEQKSGLNVDALFAALGGQGAVGLSLARDFRFDPAALTARPFASIAVTYLQEVTDKGVAASALDRLRLELEEGRLAGQFRLKTEDHGFSAAPLGGEKAALPTVRGSIEGDHLVVAFGSSALVDRSFSAFREGKETLGGDAAHAKARAEMQGRPQLLLWFDSGRAAAVAPEARLGTDGAALGLPLRFRTSGDDRITMALALTVSPEPAGLRYHVEALNLLTTLPASTAASAARALSGASPSPADPKAGAGEEGGETIGIEACDEYVRKMPRCIDNMPAPAQERARDTLRTSRETWLMAAEGPGRAAVRRGCEAARDSLANNPFCR